MWGSIPIRGSTQPLGELVHGPRYSPKAHIPILATVACILWGITLQRISIYKTKNM